MLAPGVGCHQTIGTFHTVNAYTISRMQECVNRLPLTFEVDAY